MREIEQTFFGTPEQCFDRLVGITLDNGDITVDASVPLHDGMGGYNLVVVLHRRRPWTPEEKAEGDHAEHIEGVTFDRTNLGRIKVNPVGNWAVWKCTTSKQGGRRWAVAAASRIKRLQLGSDPIVTRYTEDGQIEMETTVATLVENEPPKVRARRFGIRDVSRLERWDVIENEFVPKGLTQEEMAEATKVSVETVKKDIAKMKNFQSEFPNTCKSYP